MSKFLTGLVVPLSVLFAFSYANAKSGCCSWHGGVSHCDTSTGRQICNDGSYSPSCTCQYVPKPPPQQTSTTPTAYQSAPTVSSAQIKTEVTNSKSDYFKDFDGFRERLVDEFIGKFPDAKASTITYYVYTILPDVTCASNKFNCPDLITKEGAQKVYDKCMQEAGSDVHNLDADNDGQACEANE